MDATLQAAQAKLPETKSTVAALATVATTIHAEIDKVVALHDQAETACPWLVKARAALSDALGNMGSHTNP